MFLFFGTSCKEEVVCEVTNVVCPVCNAMTMATLVYSYSYFHLFFIPQFEQMKNGTAPDFSSMTRADWGSSNGRRCPGCGADVDPRYAYCPFCGTKMH